DASRARRRSPIIESNLYKNSGGRMTAPRSAAGLPWVWGSDEGAEDFGDAEPRTARRALRAVPTAAHADALFLWPCQLRRAPYSYDWLDNFGRRSPRTPDRAMAELRVGQRVMTIFTLTAFVPGRSLHITMRPGW